MEVAESFASESLRRWSWEELGPSRPIEGSTSRFCLLGGRISSRSTGTPRETRKRRRMRERVQLGGCIGGGETSCCHNDSDLSDKNGDVSAMDGLREWEASDVERGVELGRMALMYGAIAPWISSGVVQAERLRGGYNIRVSARVLQRRHVLRAG